MVKGGIGLLSTMRIWYYFSVPRTWLFALLSYHFGYYIGSGGDLGWRLWVGDIIYGPIGTGATNFINMVYDQKEDSLNKPVRTTYIRFVTATQLLVATWLFYVASVLLSLPFRDSVFMGFTLLSVFHSHQYSAPPLRFKKHWLTNNTFLSLGSNTVPFLAGWMLSRPLGDLPLAAMVLEAVFILFTLVSKDVPDIEGDKFAEMATIPLDFGLRNYKTLAYVPLALGLSLVLYGSLEARYLLFVCPALVALAFIFHKDTDKKLASHDDRIRHFVKVFTYSQMGNCLLYTLMAPQHWLFGLATALVTLVFIFTSGYLYPDASCGVEAANPQHGG